MSSITTQKSSDAEKIIDARFKTPLAGLIAGKPGSGKSHWLHQLLLHQDIILDKPYTRVYWFYGQENDFTASLPKLLPNINLTLIKGVPDNFEKYLDPQVNKLIVLDDVMRQCASNHHVTDLYSLQCRHTQTSIIILLQNLNYHGSERLTFLRCSHLLVLFNEPLDQSLIYSVANKIMPRRPKVFMDIFARATSDPYSPLVIDGNLNTDNDLRLRSHIFHENIQYVYKPN